MNLAIPTALLFDLDGTLLDTAPDMIGALNALRTENDLPINSDPGLRQFVSKGALGLLGAGMPSCSEAQHESWRLRFLELYSQDLSRRTVLFDGMQQVLNYAEANQIGLGIVTNKPAFLTDPLVRQLGLSASFGSVISGDTLAKRKPDPEPVLLACEQLGVEPSQAWFVGDDERDIEAGNAAGTLTIAATYGYVLPDQQPENWQATAMVHHASELLDLLPA